LIQKREGKAVRRLEWKLLSELMKNSRRSDRDLAKAIGSSQPTVTRARNRLEKEGYIREYTVIPDFAKLGFQIMAFTFLSKGKELAPTELEKARKLVRKTLRETGASTIMVERGSGLGQDGVIISFHKDYAAYLRFRDDVSQGSYGISFKLASFLTGLSEDVHYKPLTFSTLTKVLLAQEEKEKKEKK